MLCSVRSTIKLMNMVSIVRARPRAVVSKASAKPGRQESGAERCFLGPGADQLGSQGAQGTAKEQHFDTFRGMAYVALDQRVLQRAPVDQPQDRGCQGDAKGKSRNGGAGPGRR